MTSSADRTKAFNAARRAELPRLARIQKDTIGEVVKQLRDAAAHISERLLGLADGMQRRQMEAIQREIAVTLEAFRTTAAKTAYAAAGAAWEAGLDLTRLPLLAGGVAYAPHVNLRGLLALRSTLTHLVSDISMVAVNRINSQLAQVMLGAVPASDALSNVQRILGGAARQRASTIVYTELGRAYSTAAQESLEGATEQLPGLKKRWIRSGKLHPRPDHVVAHAQLRDVKMPFLVGGVAIMYPRDPKAPASHTINCGCLSVPVTDGSTWGKATMRLDPFDAHTRVRIERND